MDRAKSVITDAIQNCGTVVDVYSVACAVVKDRPDLEMEIVAKLVAEVAVGMNRNIAWNRHSVTCMH